MAFREGFHRKVTKNNNLTIRELQLVISMAQNCYSYKELANIFNLSEHTITTHIINIQRKLRIHSKVELVKWAVENGYVRWNIKS